MVTLMIKIRLDSFIIVFHINANRFSLYYSFDFSLYYSLYNSLYYSLYNSLYYSLS